MKKKLLVIVSVLLLVLLAACGNSESKPKEKEKSDVKVDKNVDEKQDASEEDEEDAKKDEKKDNEADSKPVVEGPVVYTAKQEILDAQWQSGMLQVNDKVIQLPMSLSELLAMGFDYKIDGGNKKKEYLFAGGEVISYTLLLEGEEICYLNYWYTGDGLATLEEINPKVEAIDYLPLLGTSKLTFFLPGGVTLGDTMQAVEEKLGEPLQLNSNAYAFEYIYGRVNKGIDQCEVGVRVTVSRDTQTVANFKVVRNVEVSKYESFSADIIATVQNLQSDDAHEVRYLFPEEHIYFGDYTAETAAETVFEKDGEVYWLKLSFTGLLQRYLGNYELLTGGTLLYEATDENGMSCRVYDSGYIYCFKEPFVLKLIVNMEPLSKKDADVNALYQEYLIELGKTVQY